MSLQIAVQRGQTGRATSLNYRLGRFVLRRYGSCVALILTLALVNCFWRLSTSVVSDLDEARYGVAASEMLRGHSALVATYAGRPEYWNLKPPLGYWMQELAYKLLGPTVFALRVPAALCALCLIALTMSACRRWYGHRHALLAGLILTSCFGFISHHGARSGDLDSALSLIVLAAVVQIPRLAASAPARLLWAVMVALGFLLKSFAILPLLLITALYLAWSGDWHRTRWRDWMPAFAVLSGIIVGWVLARYRTDGSMYFVDRMVREDLFGRATRIIDDETTRPWGYLTVLLDRFAPWPLFILAAALLGRLWRQQPQRNQSRLVLLWALVPLIAFSLARTQHHWYLDPTYPAWSMLGASASLQLVALAAPRRRVLVISLVVLAVLFCEIRVMRRIGVTDRRPQSQSFLMSLQNHSLVSVDQTIYASFPLAHSERFILQVVDGYQVVDLQPAPASIPAPERTGVLLLRREQSAVVAASHPNWRVIGSSPDYVLMGRAAASQPTAMRSN